MNDYSAEASRKAAAIQAEAVERYRRAECYEPLLAALDEIAWPLKDEAGCGGVTVLPKTVADLQQIAKDAIAKAREPGA